MHAMLLRVAVGIGGLRPESILERVAHPPALAGGMRAHEVRQNLNNEIQHLTLRLLNGQHDPPSIARHCALQTPKRGISARVSRFFWPPMTTESHESICLSLLHVQATTTQNPGGSEGQSNNTIYSILLTLSKLLHPCCTSLPTAMMLTSYLVRRINLTHYACAVQVPIHYSAGTPYSPGYHM